MDGRGQAREKALSFFMERVVEAEPYDSHDLLMCYRYFEEPVVGRSIRGVERLLREAGLAMGEGEEAAFRGIRLRREAPLPPIHGNPPGFLSLVASAEGRKAVRVEWRDSTTRSGEPLLTASLREFDPADPGYPYPERIASATRMQGKEGPDWIGNCAFSRFGRFVEAMDLLRPAVMLEEALSEQDHMRALRDSDYLPVLRHDGGAAGSLALECASAMHDAALGRVMEWARSVLPEVARSFAKRGLIWGSRYLNYNDLDDSACALPLGEGRLGVFHENTSLISPFRAFTAVAVLDPDGEVARIEVTALESGVDSIPAHVAALAEGRPSKAPVYVHRVKDGSTTCLTSPDPTDMLSTFSFHLNCDLEMVRGMQEGGEELDDFSAFAYEGEEDSAPPAP